MKRLSLFVVIAMFMFFSCEEDEGVDSRVKLPITFGIQSGLKSGDIHKSAAQNISFSKGHMLIGSLGFEAENIQDEDSLDIEFEIEKTLKVDLGDLQNPDTMVTIPAGEYEEVEIETELMDPDTLSSIYMKGTYINTQDEEIPLVFDYRDDMEFEIEGEADDGDAITLTSDVNPLARVTFSPDSLFSNISADMLEQAQLDKEGVLLISEDFNAEIYDKVVDRLDESSEAVFQE
jgi:hypothetical protein